MNYDESIDWLYSTQTFGIKLGLENTTRLLETLDLDSKGGTARIIHVAGTNGKGSVCAFSEKILRDAGLKTGLFTSPHLISYTERIQINGIPASEAIIADTLTRIRELVAEWENHPTFFEISLAVAMDCFREAKCEIIILETGMGGRLDATNAILADVSVITPIGLDHQQWLGETIREIAGEKAGILKRNVPVVVADLHPDARDVVGRKALTLGIPYIEAHPLPAEWKLGLPGLHQRENAALAVEAACRVESDRLTQDGIRKSLEETSWPGRFQSLEDRRVILDGAHNPEAAKALATTWKEEFGEEKAFLLFGAVESKDVVEVLRELTPILAGVFFVPVKSQRGVPTEKLRAALREAGPYQLYGGSFETIAEALAEIPRDDHRILVAGSLFLIGETLGHYQNESFEVSLQ